MSESEKLLSEMVEALEGCTNVIEARCAGCMRGEGRMSTLEYASHGVALCELTEAENTIHQISRALIMKARKLLDGRRTR